MKTCKVCGGDGPFGKRQCCSDGLMQICKSCINTIQRQRSNTPKRLASQAWESMKKRANNANGKNPSYANVAVTIGRTEFMAWAVDAFAEWMQAHPSETPSINRIDPAKAYEAGNLEIIEWGENARLRRANKNVHAPEGKSWCGGCKAYLPVEAFAKSAETLTGRQKRCRKCFADMIRTYWVCCLCGHKFTRALDGPPKRCPGCKGRSIRSATDAEMENVAGFARRTRRLGNNAECSTLPPPEAGYQDC